MHLQENSIGIFTTDAGLTVRAWDRWLAEVTGISAEEAHGRKITEIIPDLEKRGMLAHFEKTLKEGAVEILAPAFHHYLIPCSTQARSKRFDTMQQRVIIAPLREQDRVVGTIITIEDVTARIERERDLAEQLTSDDESARLQAASAFAEEKDIDGEPHLLGAIGDGSWRVRRAAVGGLAGRMKSETVLRLLRAMREDHTDLSVLNSTLQLLALSDIDVIEPLSEFLTDTDSDLRAYAALALGEIHDPRSVAPLIKALEDEDVNVRYHAIESLGRLRATEAVEPLLEIAEARDFFLSFAAIDALTRIGDSSVASPIAHLIEDEMLRAAAVDALGVLGDEDALAPLASLLERADAPAVGIAQALAAIYDRYETILGEGALISDLARSLITARGAQNLVLALDHASGEELRALAVALGWLEGAEVERALARLLGHTVARREVIEAMVRHGRRVTDLLIEQLRAPDDETRKAAINALGRISDERALPALIGLLDESNDIVIAATVAIARIGDRRAFEDLIELLSHTDAAVRQSAIAALNSLGHPDMPARAKDMLDDPDSNVRESAVRIAGYFGFGECADLLLDLCSDPEEGVRRAAIEQLPYIEDDRAIDVLISSLKNESAGVRAAAARAFAYAENAQATSHLIEALTDEDSWVRYFAARSTGKLDSPEAVDILGRLAQTDEFSHVRIAAMEALGRRGGPRAASILAPLAEATDLDVARAALLALGAMGHPDALPPLMAALRSTHRERRLEAVRALGLRGDASAADALKWTAATCEDEAVVDAAIESLASIATAESIAAIIALTSDPSRRKAAIERLAHIGVKHIEQVARGLEHPQAEARSSVIEALSRMKHPLASESISRALDDVSPQVRATAALSLGRLGNRSVEQKLASMARQDSDALARQAAQKALKK